MVYFFILVKGNDPTHVHAENDDRVPHDDDDRVPHDFLAAYLMIVKLSRTS